MLFIANGDRMVDRIPMHEILSVNEMSQDPSSILLRPSAVFLHSRKSRNYSLDAASSGELLRLASTEQPQTVPCEETESRRFGGRTLAIQINTIADGFNFGKIYYLRAISNASNRAIVPKLTSAARAAKSRMHRNSLLQNSQDSVKRVHESFIFQLIMAILIMTVILSVSFGVIFASRRNTVSLGNRTSLSTQRRRKST